MPSLKSSRKRRSLFFGGLAFLMGCTGITDGIAEYKVVRVENKPSELLLVSAVPQNVSVNQNGARTVTLPYESRRGAFPVACELESLVQITEAAPCACDKKVCEVKIRPPADVHGEGSFAFRLIDTVQAPTELGIVKVKILPVRVSVDSGSEQEGTVGTTRPLVALVQNSDRVPVSGVKVSWRILDEVSGKDGKLEEPGKGLPCKGVVSDDQGKARCDWTLGTRVGVDRVSDIRRVEASIFDSAKEALKPAPAQFTATIKSGPATKLAFPNEYPKPFMAAGKMGPIGVYPQDAYGNLAETPRSFEVTLTSMKGPKPNEAGASETFGTPVTATLPPKGGVILKDLFIKKVGVYFLVASSPDLPGSTAEGPDFRVVPDKADRLVFVQQPGRQPEQQPGQPQPSGRGIAGAIWAQQPKVRALDTYGNEIPGFSSAVTLVALRIGESSGANTLENPLEGTLTIPGIDGVATFTDLKINKVGQYRLEASSSLEASSPSTLLRGESAPIDIDPAAASKLVFVKPQPSGSETEAPWKPPPQVAGVPWTPSPQVAVEDFFGNRVTSGAPVSVMIAIRTSTGNNPIQLLGGVTTVKTVNGVADFTGLSFKLAGEYKLTATSSGLFWDTSGLFKIASGPRAGLAFIQSPGNGTVGEALAPSPQVAVKDEFGNTVTTSTIHVDLGIDSSNENLLGGTRVQTVEGVATFPGLSINKTGTYKLKASSEVLPGVTSPSLGFKLGPKIGVGAKLVFTTQPVGGTADFNLSQQPKVTVRDAHGNMIPAVEVTLAVEGGEKLLYKDGIVGDDGKPVPLESVKATTAGDGVATFSGLSIRKVGTYTLTASSSGLTGDPSSSFIITVGAANKLSFNPQPVGGTADSNLSQQPKVTVQDAYENMVSAVEVTLTVTGGGKLLYQEGVNGSDGKPAALGSVKATTAGDGVATFSGLAVRKVGRYTLTASGSGLTGDPSSSFTITHGSAARLVFTTQPGGAVAGVPFTTQPLVAIRDAHGNDVTTGADGGAGLTMSLATGSTGTLSGTKTVGASLGVSSWSASSLSIDAFGSKILRVNKPDLTASGGAGSLSATSDSFNVEASAPPVPTGLTARAGDGSVVLSWTASSGATGYNILRGTSAGSLTLIGTSSTNSYTDSPPSNGVIYFYAVQAVSVKGTSANSSSIQAKPLSTPSISTVAVNDTAGTGALYLSWSASTGASNYRVRYSTTSGSASSGTTGCTGTALNCIITGLASGTAYYFSVNATNADFGSMHSEESSGIPRTKPTLSLPPGHKQITPTFASTGATSFDLSYGTSAGSYSSTRAGANSGTAITGLVNGTTYYFRVVAYFPNGSLSSTEASAAPNGPQAFTITSATPGNTKVDLVWGSSAGATSYMVKYGTSSGSYATPPFATGFTGTSITVTGLTNGTTYYFMVTAVNASGSQDASAEFVRTPTDPLSIPGNPAEAAAAWSTKRIVPNYTGYAMRVRHGTNGAIAGVSFDSAGRVSASSTVTIISSGTSAGSSGGQTGWQSGQTMPFSTFYSDNATVYVATWYDQSGNGNHATQVKEDQQPVIVTSGTLEEEIVFADCGRNDAPGSSYFNVPYTSSLDLHSSYSIVAKMAKIAKIGGKAFMFSQDIQDRAESNIQLSGASTTSYLSFYLSRRSEEQGRSYAVVEPVHNKPYVVYGSYNGNQFSLRVNGIRSQPTVVGALPVAEGRYFIGRDWIMPYWHSSMRLSEIIIYKKSLGD